MLTWADSALIVATGFFAATVASITGGGVTVILLPLLVLHFGIHAAMPIVTLALVAASSSRVVVNRREIVPPVAGWFSLGSLPLAAAGTLVFTLTAPGLLTRVLGGFLLVAAGLRWVKITPPPGFHPAWFLPLGAAFGFLTGISAAVGAVLAPFFLAFGLKKGAYVGTLGLSLFLIQLVKVAVFLGRDFLRPQVLAYGALLVPVMVLGTVAGKRILERLSERVFERLIEGVMVVAGSYFLLRGAG